MSPRLALPVSLVRSDLVCFLAPLPCSDCLDRLASNKPPKGKAPTILEIESAMGAAFNPSVFGSTLAQTLEIQADLYPNDRVPIILPFLANGILALGGASTEGIFRVPGDGDGVAMLKDRIDRGQYQLNGIDDPHIAASLLKLWLRELQEPLIPPSKYNSALAVSSDPVAVCDLIRSLPQCVSRCNLSFHFLFLRLTRPSRLACPPESTGPLSSLRSRSSSSCWLTRPRRR